MKFWKKNGILPGGKGYDPQCPVCLTGFRTRTQYGPSAQLPETCSICDVAKKAGVKVDFKSHKYLWGSI